MAMTMLRLRSESVTWRTVDDEVVAVDVLSSTYLSANPSGALLWELLARGTTRQELAERLVEHFGIDRGRADADVDAVVRAVDERGLLER